MRRSAATAPSYMPGCRLGWSSAGARSRSRPLQADYPDRLEMRVSHDTIYQALHVQGRGELRRELTWCCVRTCGAP